MNVPMIDIGKARLGMMVAERFRRKRKITSTTSAMVSSSVNFTSLTLLRMETDRSYSVVMEMAVGICCLRRGIIWLMEFAISTVLVPGCFWMGSTTER